MTHTNSEYLEHQRKRWMRPDAHRFVRPAWRRFVRPGFERDHPFALYERKFDPTQPRVPAGDPAGGQWTNSGSQGVALLTSAESGASSRRSFTVQFSGQQRSTFSEILLSNGGQNVGSFGNGVSVVKGPNVSHQESFDAENGITTLSFTGVGSVVVDEKADRGIKATAYSVGTRARPDIGLSITIGLSGVVRAYSTLGS